MIDHDGNKVLKLVVSDGLRALEFSELRIQEILDEEGVELSESEIEELKVEALGEISRLAKQFSTDAEDARLR